jgi:hypothetical protein
MRITFWLFAISILVSMVGSSGCAINNKVFHASIGMTGPTTVARHGFQPVIFTNNGRYPVVVHVSPSGDVFTVHPGHPAIVKMDGGLYSVQVTDAATGKNIGRSRELFVPNVGQEKDYNGSTYAVRVKVDGRR